MNLYRVCEIYVESLHSIKQYCWDKIAFFTQTKTTYM